MKFKSREAGDVLIFDLKGRPGRCGPDTYKIKEEVSNLLAKGHRKFLLNLDNVGYVNSTGIGIIASVFQSIGEAKGSMKICNANEKVSRVMMITKLLEVFDSYSQEKEALAAFQSA